MTWSYPEIVDVAFTADMERKLDQILKAMESSTRDEIKAPEGSKPGQKR